MEQRGRLWLAAPLLVAAALFLPSIGQRTIAFGDEARYALLARNMLESGDWLIPRLDGEAHMEKSPLFMWTIAALSLPGGEVTELTATLPAALSAIGGVGATLLLGRRMFGPRAGLLAAFALATTFGYYWHARLALADMMVTFFVVVGAVAFWTSLGEGQARRAPLVLFWVCVGLALAAKGPAGLMPILPFAAFLVTEHGWWRGVRELKPLMGIATLVLVSLPWALAFALQGERSYVQSVLVEDYLVPRREGWLRVSELYFALGSIGVGFLPWTLFLPAAVHQGWLRAESTGLGRKFRFLAFWVLAYVVVITVMPHKRDRYLLPVFPALALMVGWLWDRWATHARAGTLRIYGWVGLGLALALAVAALLAPARPELAALIPPALGPKLLLGGVLLGAGVAAVATARAGRALAMFSVICISTILVLAYETQVFVGGHNRTYGLKALSERLVARVRPQDQLVTYRLGPLALQFYTRRTIPELSDPQRLEPLLTTGRPLYVIVHEQRWPALSEGGGRTWTVVDRAPFGQGQVLVATPAARP